MPPSSLQTVSRAIAATARLPSLAHRPSMVSILTDAHRTEVLAFLDARPLHTVVMAGFIHDNGVESHLNRGTFYACRDAAGQIEGVALIGHSTLVETRSDAALKAFARLTRECRKAHVIMGEQDRIQRFWGYYAEERQAPRLLCRELLFEQRRPSGRHEEVSGLRRATQADLRHVMPVQAQMALEESGVDPSVVDPLGFRSRCARRIEQGRVWVWIENERLLFKADVISATPEANYLEGIYVAPAERGKGYGLRCISQLGRTLLTRTRSLCLLVNEQNHVGQAFYRRAGYTFRAHYDTIYLQQKKAG